MLHPRILHLDWDQPLTAQRLLDWYMAMCSIGLMWNPDDDPGDIVNLRGNSPLFRLSEVPYLRGIRNKIHETFLDPCEIALHAIGCHEAGMPAIAIAGMGNPRAVAMAAATALVKAAAAPAYTPAPLTLFYLRMYHEGKRRTAHCVCSRTSALLARIEVIRMLGDEWRCDETKTICTVSDLVCIQLN